MAIFKGTAEQIESTENKVNSITENETSDDSKRYATVKAVRDYVGKSNRVISTVVEYKSSVSGTTPPTGMWQSTVPTVAAGSYLWSRTVITYSDNSTSTIYGVSRMGKDGENGSGGSGGSSVPYETGEWTPTCTGWLDNIGTKSGTYERIGNQVYCTMLFANYSAMSNTQAANNTTIGTFSGLPFSPKRYTYIDTDDNEEYLQESNYFTIYNSDTSDGDCVSGDYSIRCSKTGNCTFYYDTKVINWSSTTVSEKLPIVKGLFGGYVTQLRFMYEI